MKKSMFKIFINNSLMNLPTPTNISTWWNMGSILGMCLIMQITTGIILTMHYCPDTTSAFNSLMKLSREMNNGWLMRTIHMNGASMFFICMYTHVKRGMYYSSYMYYMTWTTGVMILLTTMTTAFMGYVLPWGQMSLWGATVITNLLSTIPYLGKTMIQWLWGGFTIENATLNRLFTFHFLMPFILMAMLMIHLMFLHKNGSNNPLGTNSNIDKIPFHPYFTFKDLMSFMMTMMMMLMMTLYKPYMMSDPENFTPANSLLTPNHIQPEWYFLFAYAILRSIPNKLGGVTAMLMSIMILLIMPMFKKKIQSSSFYPINKILFWSLVTVISMLNWIGTQPVKEPFILTSQILTTMYFLYFPTLYLMSKMWEKLMFMK